MESALSGATRPASPALRRAYFDCRYGQLHVYQAIPPGGGFDERTSLLCLPSPQVSAAIFQPLLTQLGADRSVFAIDPPGVGQSDGAGGDAAAPAAAVHDFLRSMRIRRVQVLADGAAAGVVAALLGMVTGQVTGAVLCGAPASELAGLEGRGVPLAAVEMTVAELVAGGAAATAGMARLRASLDSAGH